MKKALIIPNSAKAGAESLTASVIDKLKSLCIDAEVNFSFWKEKNAEPDLDFSCDADVIIVIGGDGSVLDAAKYSYAHDIPILCINLGKMGYLSELEPTTLDTLDAFVTGEYFVNEKMMLEVSYSGDGNVKKYAVNDVVISHETFLGIANINLEDAVGNSINYRADGLIVATPQGSTAYSLSAGGPVLAHDVESIIVTPVCAHSFFNRSVLFNSAEKIKVKKYLKMVKNKTHFL